MIAIKIGLDKGGFEKLEGFPGLAIPEIQANKLGGLVPAWTDRSQISTRFISAFNNEYYSHDSSLRNFIKNIDYFKNVDRTFGVIKALRPQVPVTRAEAAICVSLIGNHLTADASTEKIGFRTAEQALQLKVGKKSAPNSQ